MDDLTEYDSVRHALLDAVEALDRGITILFPVTRLEVGDALDTLKAGIQAMPDECYSDSSIQRDIIEYQFISDVAQAYCKQTGKTISGNGGEFAEFLLAVADELGIDTKGLVMSAMALMEEGGI